MQELLGRKDQLHKAVHKNFEGLEYLKSTNINYNIIAISDKRTMKHLEISQNINLKNYNFEYTPSVTLTESTSGGIMLYIANHLPYKPRLDQYDNVTFTALSTTKNSIFTEHLSLATFVL